MWKQTVSFCAVVTASKGFVRESVGDNVSEDRRCYHTSVFTGWQGRIFLGRQIYGDWRKIQKLGSVEKVSIDGSRSSGTLRAYGLDCSGFVTWAVINGYMNQGTARQLGDGTSDQWEKAGNQRSRCTARRSGIPERTGSRKQQPRWYPVRKDGFRRLDRSTLFSSKNGVTVGEAYSAKLPLYQKAIPSIRIQQRRKIRPQLQRMMF